MSNETTAANTETTPETTSPLFVGMIRRNPDSETSWATRDAQGNEAWGMTWEQAVEWLAEHGLTWDGRPLVTEVKGVLPPPEKRLYQFVVRDCLRRDGDGLRVSARGPRGEIETTVYGDVTKATVVGATFWRS